MRARWTVMTLLGVIAAAAPARGAGASLQGGPETGRVVVNVAKRGLFSAFAHDHALEVTRWRARGDVPGGDPARASVEVVLEAASLRERNEALSAGDRKKVESQTAGREVLDAERYPEITWRSERVTLDPAAGAGAKVRGTMHGALTLHGATRPVDVPFDAELQPAGWRVRGRVRFKQSDFGIAPVTTMGGTVGVKDAVEIDLDVALRPAPR
jgi:polyisoprenoid-binding protein YceI